MRHLFLDLEDTVITPVLQGWNGSDLINMEKVKKVIADFKPDNVSIFSFAVHNEGDRVGFNSGMRRHLELALGIQFSLVPTMDDDIVPTCCKVLKLHPERVTFQEVCDFLGKQEAFRLYLRHTYGKTWKTWGQEIDIVFLDDAVFNEYFRWPDLHIDCRITNIDTIKD